MYLLLFLGLRSSDMLSGSYVYSFYLIFCFVGTTVKFCSCSLAFSICFFWRINLSSRLRGFGGSNVPIFLLALALRSRMRYYLLCFWILFQSTFQYSRSRFCECLILFSFLHPSPNLQTSTVVLTIIIVLDLNFCFRRKHPPTQTKWGSRVNSY